MHELQVNSEQAKSIIEAGKPLVVVDEHGRMLGHFTPASSRNTCKTPLSDADLAEIKRRMLTPAPGLTTEQVVNYLQSLENA